MTNRPPAYVIFLFGLLCGLLIGVALDKTWSEAVTKFVYSSAIVILASFGQHLESAAQRRYLAEWSTMRARGKWYFIATRYIVLRGLLALLLIGAPSIPR
jgi:SNF family Na+-dependent transporter